MPITAKQSDTQFEIVPAGNHIARCYQMVEIGTENVTWEGQTKQQYKVRLSWELPNEKKVFNPEKGEQPFSVSKDYTLSMHEKANLRYDLESWRGKGFSDDEALGFDITKLLGVACMVNVIHNTGKNGKTYANVSSVTPVPKGFTIPSQINPSFVFSYDSWNDQKFAGLPEWLRKRIEATPEFKSRFNSVTTHANHEHGEPVHSATDDLPF